MDASETCDQSNDTIKEAPKEKRVLKLRTEKEEYQKLACDLGPMFEKVGKALLEAGKVLTTSPDWNHSTVDNLKFYLENAPALYKNASIMKEISRKRGETALKDKFALDLQSLRKGTLLNVKRTEDK